MPAIPNPYVEGCKIVHGDTRSYCTCYTGCKGEYPPPAKWVMNVQPTSKYPFSLYVGRRIMTGNLMGPITCEWINSSDPNPHTRNEARLQKFIAPPAGDLNWLLGFLGAPLCFRIEGNLFDGNNECCKDLFWGLGVIWFTMLCLPGPGPNPAIDMWPVRFDFTEADL